MNQQPTRTLDTRLNLEEEQSKDRERRHAKEKASVMAVGGGFFAQQASDKEPDTTAPRKR